MQRLAPYLQVAPLTLILGVFLVVPVTMIVLVSFWSYDEFDIYPDLILDNYQWILTSPVTWSLYLKTLYYALVTWAITLLIGFTISWYLVFHVKNLIWQIGLFLLCTVPFWTSNVIRMISWIPFLGREGIFNQALMGAGLTGEPLEFLLFSDFAVILAYVHLFTLFMIVPIFNSMARIDPTLIEAAVDGGARPWQVVFEVVLPLCKTGIALGSIFVIALVMGDFVVVRTMSGGQSATVASAMMNEIALLQYPTAAAGATILLVVVTLMVAAILRVVDVRRELAG
ncbi:ABC transporter permease [Marinimicrococcus flavescens]|uniref:ABC transporter permease n=1 Tax=Marinimicrococcus flavescens TaxID=3031815 RepID=A0AAP4D5N6_9PROT|nr:ABC transporter permease [Marinimicrococcus flavescens]